MKKIKAVIALVLAVCIFTGCTSVSGDNSGSAYTSQQGVIDMTAVKENIEEYFEPMNIVLGTEWDEKGGQLLEKTNFFKAMLEDIYRFKSGEEIPNDNGVVSIDMYVNISSWNFPFDKDDVRNALENSYGYNREDDTVYMSDGLGNVRTSEIKNIKVVGENTLMVTYRYGVQDDYNEEDDKWYFSAYDTWVMKVKLEADGFTFLSNHKQGAEDIEVSYEGMTSVTDREAISAIEYMYNRSSVLMGQSWDVSEGMVTFEGNAVLGFNDALINFHRMEKSEEMTGIVNGEYRMHISDCVAQGVKYFPFTTQTLRRYYINDESYDKETDTVIAPDGYGNVCWPELQQVYTDGEYYVAEYHYVWPEEGYDVGKTLLKKGENGSFIFLANEREIKG